MEVNATSSTLSIKSNLQLIKGPIREDRRFLSSIHDPFALELMYKLGYEAITPIQKQEFRDASVHCKYAHKDDYPWGTIVNLEGNTLVVCKCTNINCSRFQVCRPDFNFSELEVEEDNAHYQTKVNVIISLISDGHDVAAPVKNKGDLIASAALLAGVTVKHEDLDEHLNYNNQEGIHDLHLIPSIETENVLKSPPSISNVSFDAFSEVNQNVIIKLKSDERTVVNAGPGTGKTWTLIEKIKFMLSVEDVAPENILVLCFSRSAVEVVRSRLEVSADREELPLNWRDIDVRTFDSFATYLLAWLQDNRSDILPIGFALDRANYEERIEVAASAIIKFADLMAEYQHVIIDEVQDLVGVRAEMVLALLRILPKTCGFTILGDSCQSLYDYLTINDSKVMDSWCFYQSIFQSYRTANYFSLTHNYRQGDELGTLLVPYRTAILNGSLFERKAEARKLTSVISTSDVNLKKFSSEYANNYLKNGTLGILTRTNGQALQISSWLRAEGIDHKLQKPFSSQALASWIGRVLMRAETDVINCDEFRSIFSELYPRKATASDLYWNALISIQRDQTKRHYEIENLLHGLIQNARNPLLFEEPTNSDPSITVSNIHRSKGREYDSVIVLADVLDTTADDDNDNILEHKVCYVALTRPKKRVEKATLTKQYIYVSKDEFRRCFKEGGWANHKYLSHFEVGESTDINMRSFASSKQIQDYIQQLPMDARLKFVRCPEGTKSYVIYKVVSEEDSRMILGYTTHSFARSVEKAIQRIYKNNNPISYKYYPEIFNDIYLNGLTTCISTSDSEIDGAKRIGNMWIWYGLEISGFAQSETTRY